MHYDLLLKKWCSGEKIITFPHEHYLKFIPFQTEFFLHRITSIQSNNHFFQKWQKKTWTVALTRLSAHFNLESISFFTVTNCNHREITAVLSMWRLHNLDRACNEASIVYSWRWRGIMFPTISLVQLHFSYPALLIALKKFLLHIF